MREITNYLSEILNLSTQELLYLEKNSKNVNCIEITSQARLILQQKEGLWRQLPEALARADHIVLTNIEKKKEIMNLLYDIKEKTALLAHLWLKNHYKAQIIFQLRYMQKGNINGLGANFACSA